MVGWDEVMEGDVSEDCVIMNWRKPEEGLKAIEKGHKTIFACSKWCYLNIVESRLQDEIGAKSATPLSVEKVYSFRIMPDSISDNDKKLVLGAQGAMWTEYIPTAWKLEKFLFPRLAALAENVWTSEDKKSWDNFAQKVERQTERYDLWGARYSDAFFRMNDIKRDR